MTIKKEKKAFKYPVFYFTTYLFINWNLILNDYELVLKFK